LKDRAIRRRQRRGLAKALKKLHARVTSGRLKKRDKIVEAVGRLKERFPKARGFVTVTVREGRGSLSYVWNVAKFRAALARDGAYLLRSNQAGWSAQEFWKRTSNSRWSNAPSVSSRASYCYGRSGTITAAAPRRTSAS